MPSNKIYTILVLCIGIVVSIWLLARKPEQLPAAPKTNTVSVINTQDRNIDTTTDWQKILVAIDTNSQKTSSVVPAGANNTFDDTTLTAQMAKDFFARYLSIANSGDVTPETAATIANKVLASAEYTKSTGAVYIASNLHINPKTDTATTKQYLDNLNAIIEKRGINNNNDDPMSIIAIAIKEDDENELKKIDPLIVKVRSTINDLLTLHIPADAVQIHLDLLNTSSNLLSNLEAIRATFSDPVRSFAGASQYVSHLSDFVGAIKNMRAYFAEKL